MKIFEEFFVDVAEHVAIVAGIEVDAVDLFDDLAHQCAVFHVVVGIFEGHTNRPAILSPVNDRLSFLWLVDLNWVVIKIWVRELGRGPFEIHDGEEQLVIVLVDE